MKKILYIIFVIFFFSCNPPEIKIDSKEKEKFLFSTEVGFYLGGKGEILYDKETHQISTNRKRKQIRIQNDTQTEFVDINMQNRPHSLGVHTIIDFHILNNGEISSFSQLYECSKINSEYYWLWNSETKTGFIIPKL